jgi:hypothetical protein
MVRTREVPGRGRSGLDSEGGESEALGGRRRDHAGPSGHQSPRMTGNRIRDPFLDDPKWANRLTDEDRRALNALFWAHVNAYSRFRLDMTTPFDLGLAA